MQEKVMSLQEAAALVRDGALLGLTTSTVNNTSRRPQEMPASQPIWSGMCMA